MSEVPPSSAPPASSSDLSPGNLVIGVVFLFVLAIVAGIFMPFPKLFAAPGEDRASIEPWHPQLRVVLDQAKAGNIQAMRALAQVFLQGREAPQDIPQALKWLTKAADAGDLDSMNTLGILYVNGRFAPRDPATAIKYFRAAADKGDPGGLLNLATCYATGQGVPGDREMATTFLNRVLATGNQNQRAQAANMLRQLAPR